jgi:transposase
MPGNLSIRKVRTASGAIAVQVIKYAQGKRVIVRHIGSSHSEEELTILCQEAEIVREQLSLQPSLFSIIEKPSKLLHEDHLQLNSITHRFAYTSLKKCLQLCELAFLHPLYQDLALMRIVEPASKLRTIELLANYFEISYAERSVYRLLPKLLEQKDNIENAAYQTAKAHFGESFALVLYDVTTLYFESHEPNDELKARGFSKDDKSKQPQIVVGLLVTLQGFPLKHEIYKGNTFEGHTMLDVVKEFQKYHTSSKPIIVADAAMLSQENMLNLETEGYQYIVGARLANASKVFIDSMTSQLKREDGNIIRLSASKRSYDVICAYSEKRAKKDKYEFDKQIAKANEIISQQESGKRAKFVKKSTDHKDSFILNEELREKAEKLIGIKGYCTNIPESILSNAQVIEYYHGLWHVEQTFRMSKTDLKTRPIFHYTHDAIKAHIIVCFMGLMMGKFLEIKTGLSLRKIRDILWDVQEAHIKDGLTGKCIVLQTNIKNFNESKLAQILKPH